MTADEFTEWRFRLRLNKTKAAAALGLSRNSVIAYENGKKPIPRHVALACMAIAHGIQETNK